MKLVIQAGKLQRVLTSAKEIVGKSNAIGSLNHHILIQINKNFDEVKFLAGDKELNHYINIKLEKNSGESASFIDDHKFLSIACLPLLDAITGVSKETLVSIDGSKVYQTEENLSQATVTYTDTVVRVEASRGIGYILFRDELKQATKVLKLTIDQAILREMLDSTAFVVSPKPRTTKNIATQNLLFYLFDNRLEIGGTDSIRIAYATYNYEDPEKVYGSNNQVELNSIDPLQVGISRKSITELQKFLVNKEGEIDLKFYMKETNQVRMVTIEDHEDTLIFSINAHGNFILKNFFPKEDNDDFVVSFKELMTRVNTANKFGTYLSLSIGENPRLKISTHNNETNDSFNSSMDLRVAKGSINVRLLGKEFAELINSVLSYNPTALVGFNLTNFSRSSEVLYFRELHHEPIQRVYFQILVGVNV